MRIEWAPRRKRSIVSLTPLIDVVFILLVFFMLASSFLDWRSASLAIPPLGDAAAEAESELIVIRLTDSGEIVFDGEVTDRAGLDVLISQALAADSERPMVLRPEPGVPLRDIMWVVDSATAAGGTNLSLQRGGE
ncbi:biopolymer transport protein ExbD [Natronocella acetinitrilica]|uniref:Biopolymer transport protein ExbD n=1 Tax=Natronocella acetinitrilica TaxID=414046 RepID=A0AAE3G0K5_9GAMM|nr:biopolymer transporter ExbD [Natronocella acetinitrilica]MCP1673164.1 biopolymer transport protein ExbD [Natronocella acetinitrilica]